MGYKGSIIVESSILVPVLYLFIISCITLSIYIHDTITIQLLGRHYLEGYPLAREEEFQKEVKNFILASSEQCLEITRINKGWSVEYKLPMTFFGIISYSKTMYFEEEQEYLEETVLWTNMAQDVIEQMTWGQRVKENYEKTMEKIVKQFEP